MLGKARCPSVMHFLGVLSRQCCRPAAGAQLAGIIFMLGKARCSMFNVMLFLGMLSQPAVMSTCSKRATARGICTTARCAGAGHSLMILVTAEGSGWSCLV